MEIAKTSMNFYIKINIDKVIFFHIVLITDLAQVLLLNLFGSDGIDSNY